MVENCCIIVAGPTGVGKTDVVDAIALKIDAEIINGDMGQFYTPLTIGTAKPNWQASSVPHHLFDIINVPVLFSVVAFREQVSILCNAIWQRKKIPIIVGGSSYYIATLFFPPRTLSPAMQPIPYSNDKDIWHQLAEIDPERAQEIDKSDTYRIQRALDIWQNTGIKPSSYKPLYDPIANFVLIWLSRDRADLYHRIDMRVRHMIEHGWIEEVKMLLNTDWENFLLNKKIIGYPEIIAYCHSQIDKNTMIKTIQQKTRNYAKRQMSFWRMLYKKIDKNSDSSQSKIKPSLILEVNLTREAIDRYIKQLKSIVTM